MASIPHHFVVGSAASASSNVIEVIQSYRRAQYLNTDAHVSSSLEPSSPLRDAEADTGLIEEDEDVTTPTFHRTPRDDDSLIGDFEWDEDPVTPQQETPSFARRIPTTSAGPVGHHLKPQEGTPLLKKSLSFSLPKRSRKVPVPQVPVEVEENTKSLDAPTYGTAASTRRRSSATSGASDAKTIKHDYGGKSTFGQTMFNSIAILLGIGMLSEPLAFAYAGWIGGTLLNIFYGWITCYTAKILAHIILSDPRLRSYSDIGRKAFGPRSTMATSLLFCSELFAVGVILVTLFADSLHSIIPQYSSNTYKIWGLLILIPTVFSPLSLLSYTSVLGIFSTLMIIVVIFVDGLSKKERPGSLWSPEETTWGVESLRELGVAFGLFMAGFSGHAVIPSLARDMINPDDFDQMINWAFAITTLMYGSIGFAGYLMFGRYVSDEVSIDLLRIKGYNPLLNRLALWSLVVTPLSKFALATRPLNITLEILLGLDPTPPVMINSKGPIHSVNNHSSAVTHHTRKRIFVFIERALLTIVVVAVSIAVPEFGSMMAFLGSFSAFMICVIGPISAKIAMKGRCGKLDAILLTIGVVMAGWGTIAAFL